MKRHGRTTAEMRFGRAPFRVDLHIVACGTENKCLWLSKVRVLVSLDGVLFAGAGRHVYGHAKSGEPHIIKQRQGGVPATTAPASMAWFYGRQIAE